MGVGGGGVWWWWVVWGVGGGGEEEWWGVGGGREGGVGGGDGGCGVSTLFTVCRVFFSVIPVDQLRVICVVDTILRVAFAVILDFFFIFFFEILPQSHKMFVMLSHPCTVAEK